MVNVYGKLKDNGGRWMMEKRISLPCIITYCASLGHMQEDLQVGRGVIVQPDNGPYEQRMQWTLMWHGPHLLKHIWHWHNNFMQASPFCRRCWHFNFLCPLCMHTSSWMCTVWLQSIKHPQYSLIINSSSVWQNTWDYSLMIEIVVSLFELRGSWGI